MDNLQELEPHDWKTILSTAALLLTLFKVAKAVYTLKYSQAAKACKGKKIHNREKANCIIKYKKEALDKQIQSLESNKGQCTKTKDPRKCATKVQSKILELKKKKSLLGR
jgi:hypothetical protein